MRPQLQNALARATTLEERITGLEGRLISELCKSGFDSELGTIQDDLALARKQLAKCNRHIELLIKAANVAAK